MRFGAYSLLLSLAAANGAFLATLLLFRSGRHRGSGWLALLTLAIALRLLPYILGFAGAYDLHPALTFAPFDLALTWGPLLWVYVTVLATDAPPPRWRLHFVPGAAQLAYQLIAFALPAPAKLDWYTGAHLELIEPAGTLLVLASLAAYGFAAWRQYDSWQRWLDENLSNREESRLLWLRVILAGFGVTGAIGLVLFILHFTIGPLDYFARLPVIVALSILSYLVALLGYRHGAQAVPIAAAPADLPFETDQSVPANESPNEAMDHDLPAPVRAGKTYAAEAQACRDRVIAAGWHRDASLTLARLAAHLATSPRSLSRTLNEGSGESFNDFVNRIRVEEAARILATSPDSDVLRVAFDVGFASKASFNRAFARHLGRTPTEVRSGQAESTSQLPPTR